MAEMVSGSPPNGSGLRRGRVGGISSGQMADMLSEPTGLLVETECGSIRLRLRRDAAPVTCTYICRLVGAGLYDGCKFYRSDFVIQCGLHGTAKRNPHGDLPVNETATGARVSNTRGTCAVAHFDVPDNGSSEWFINLGANAHLDSAYGGYAVFAAVDPGDAASFATIDSIARNILEGGKPTINFVHVE